MRFSDPPLPRLSGVVRRHYPPPDVRVYLDYDEMFLKRRHIHTWTYEHTVKHTHTRTLLLSLTHRQTDTHTNTDTNRQTDRQTDTHAHMNIQRRTRTYGHILDMYFMY